MLVVPLTQIREVVREDQALRAIERAFVAFSRGDVTVPPVGHLDFPAAHGELHVKYGWIRGSPTFVVKLATGFYDNPLLGLPSGNGCMLVFCARTGRPLALLEDEGWLTELRTGIAGAIAAKWLAGTPIRRIGIVGCGVQARFQLRCLRLVTDCRDVVVFGRNPAHVARYIEEMQAEGLRVVAAASPAAVAASADIVVTTTPSRTPLLAAADLRPGMHVTAVGADGGGKQELAADCFARADLCVVDSRAQCERFGDSSFAVRTGHITPEQLVELGTVLTGTPPRQTRRDLISIADLTGVACQDIAIAELVAQALGVV